MREIDVNLSLPYYLVPCRSHHRQGHGIDEGSKEDLILAGKLHLISISVRPGQKVTESNYEGVKGIFCRLDWARYKSDPPSSKLSEYWIQSYPSKIFSMTLF